MNEFRYIAAFWEDADGYSVIFPDIPGACTMGDNFEHAKEMAAEVLELWLEIFEEDGIEFPRARTVEELTNRTEPLFDFLDESECEGVEFIEITVRFPAPSSNSAE